MNGRWALLGALGCLLPEYLVRNNVSGGCDSMMLLGASGTLSCRL